jgi:site-specific DNA-methyltransferase (adenine-specific)
VPCKYAGTETWGNRSFHKTNSSGLVQTNSNKVNDFKQKDNVWEFLNAKDKNFKHPAPFPKELANDHIISWSNENDIIYDCFMGSGTTSKMAILNNINYIGSEISSEYCDIEEKRIKETDYKLF